MPIGMRNFKTAVAVFFCVIISKLLKLEYPFYATIAAVVTMQNSVTASIKAGGNRMLGTFVGALIGMICALIEPGSAIIASLGIIIVIYLCDRLKWNESIAIASIVFSAIMLNVKQNNAVTYSVNRLLDTFIGITIAIIVNFIIFPPNHFKILKENDEELKELVINFVKEKIILNKDTNLNILFEKIEKLEHEMKICMSESQFKRREKEEAVKMEVKLKRYKEITSHLAVINNEVCEGCLTTANILDIKKLFAIEVNSNDENKDEYYLVYNYHVSKIIKILNNL